jgi:hypothetical protein
VSAYGNLKNAMLSVKRLQYVALAGLQATHGPLAAGGCDTIIENLAGDRGFVCWMGI